MNLLLKAIRTPQVLKDYVLEDWDMLVRMARRQKLLAHIGLLIRRHGLAADCPQAALDQIRSARVYVDFVHTQAQWEVADLVRALEPSKTPLILLKGQGYIAAGIPAGEARLLSDVDVLVHREALSNVEEQLLHSGWRSKEIGDYDERYYREWMHEIPPLTHRERHIELDIHHTLFPLTGRLQPNPDLLWRKARRVDGDRLFVLAPPDMLLHSATHLFAGEVAGGFRDLVDMHELLLFYGREKGFWEELPERARQLGLERPFHYALYCADRLLGSPIPTDLRETLRRTLRRSPATAFSARLMERVLTPAPPGRAQAPIAAWLLYVRSHWIKMPPLLLASHLLRKAGRRLAPEKS